jgi:hypothetical protein
MDPETKTETVDPMAFTRERLKEVQKVWVDYAKTKLGPYVEKSQKWVRQYRPKPQEPAAN